MRITQNMIYNAYINNMSTSQESIYNLNNQISSGKRVNTPSDDPVNASTLLSSKSLLSTFNQYGRNITSGLSYLNISESALTGAKDAIMSIKDLAISAINSTKDPASLQNIGTQVNNLYQRLLSLSNTTYDNKYIFSGFMTSTAPFTPTATVAVSPGGTNTGNATATASVSNASLLTYDNYQVKFTSPTAYSLIDTTTGAAVNTGTYTLGTSNAVSGIPGINLTISDAGPGPKANDVFNISATNTGAAYNGDNNKTGIQLSANSNITIGVNGKEVFQPATGTDIFQTVSNLVKALNINDTTGMQNSLNGLDTSLNQVLNAITNIGGKVTTLTSAQTDLTNGTTSLQTSISNLEDADMLKVSSQLQMSQVALQASITSAGKVFSTNIFQYL